MKIWQRPGNALSRIGAFAASLVLAGQMATISAVAQEIPLQAQQAAIDTSVPTPVPIPETKSRLLNGQVSHESAAAAAAENASNSPVQRSGIFINGVPITGERIQDLIARIRAARAQASERPPVSLTADDYRQMEYGVLGVVFRLSGDHATVQQVFPTCPAAEAGIEPGDEVVKVGGHEPGQREGQMVFWHLAAGKAGTPVDVTVRRDGDLLTFHLVRMNIEDIQDTRIRGNYEHMLAILGPPSGRYLAGGNNFSPEQARNVSRMNWPGIAPDAEQRVWPGSDDQ